MSQVLTGAALADAAAGHFGLTGNPEECGYVLPDGRMLDLSGRHHASDYVRVNGRNLPRKGTDYFAGDRLTDHRELGDLVAEGGTDGMLRFMFGCGAVRVMPGSGFSLATMPTPRQMAVMCLAARRYRTGTYVETFDEEGAVLAYRDFEAMSPETLVEFLGEAFGGARSPGVPCP